jgi:hypothetical protein
MAMGRQLEPDPHFKLVLSTLLVSNLCDALFTLVFLQLGMARELNPLMRWLYGGSPLAFMLGKIGLVQLGVIVVGLGARLALARHLAGGVSALYLATVGYHLTLAWSLR